MCASSARGGPLSAVWAGNRSTVREPASMHVLGASVGDAVTSSYLGIFAAGVATVFSPCVLPLAPILVSGLVAGDRTSRWARLHATLWFGLGFAVVFTLLGLGVSLLVNVVRPLRSVLLAAAATMLALYGIKMMGLLDTGGRFAWMERSAGPRVPTQSRTGRPRPLILGVIFAFTWTPCAGPVLGGVLTYVAAENSRAVTGAFMLLAYAAGVAAPLVLVAAASEYVTPVLRGLRAHLGNIERTMGAVLVALGVFVVLGMPAVPDFLRGDPAAFESGRDGDLNARPGIHQLLFFHSQHCPMCRAMEAAFPALERDCKSEQWTLTPIDVDHAENAPLIQRFNVQAVPTTNLVDADGHEVFHLVGYRSPEELRRTLEREVQVACAMADELPPAADGAVEGRACDIGKTC